MKGTGYCAKSTIIKVADSGVERLKLEAIQNNALVKKTNKLNTLDLIIDSAKADVKTIVLPEGNDPRVIEAAALLANAGIANIILIVNTGSQAGGDPKVAVNLPNVEIIDARDDAPRMKYSEALYAARKNKGVTKEQAEQLLADPLLLGACMVRAGDADGMVAGATHATADVVRSALQVIGMKPDSKIVSSFFIMQHDLPHQAIQGTAIYADCGMVIDPNAEQLASIAMDSADSAVNLTGIDPKIALLSFSTAGSAEHEHVDKVRQAGKTIQGLRPELKLMTEVQFDAAIVPDILEKKAPEISVTAPANIFVFPDLQSGNIGYKIAQRIGGVQAIGPVLQGLKQPINDLSRGCSVDDIVNLVAVTARQAQTNN